MKRINSLLYLPLWFFKAKILGKQNPLQTVLFVNDQCNLRCRHCVIYSRKTPTVKSFEQVRKELEYSYKLGSRFVDFEGGEPTLWHDGEKNLNSLIRLAHNIGFYSTTVTTNAQRPFNDSIADSIWVSLDGIGRYHDDIRGDGAFDKLVKNINSCGHNALSVNMVINSRNYTSVEETIDFAAGNDNIKSISLNFHTPFKGSEELMLDWNLRCLVIDKIVMKKKSGYPVMNSVSGLERMKDMNFQKQCWVTNFIMVDGARYAQCQGKEEGVCNLCGFCMAGEMHAVMSLKPDTIFAGLNLRM
ncbi:MAG: radical SAM protein [Dysgonamonadaceae bacterium]|jgi:MoaA/NifB/PqqE/SkfB family radical SAM enzyme|nr:radical SAM protein [Dysgonamonadaceae bacterium]